MSKDYKELWLSSQKGIIVKDPLKTMQGIPGKTSDYGNIKLCTPSPLSGSSNSSNFVTGLATGIAVSTLFN